MNFFRTILTAFVLGTALVAAPTVSAGATFDGGGIEAGIDEGDELAGVAGGSLEGAIDDIRENIVQYIFIIGLIAITVAGLYLVFGFGSDTAKDRAKNILIYTPVGLAVVVFASEIIGLVNFIIGNGGDDSLITSIREALDRITQFLAIIATVAIIVAGLYMIFGFGSDDSKEKAKKIIIYTIVGLVIVALADVIVNFVEYVLGEGNRSGEEIRQTIANIVRTVLNYLALAATIVVIIAGIRLIFSMGDDDVKETTKKTIFYTLIGLLIVFVSRIIVELVVTILASAT